MLSSTFFATLFSVFYILVFWYSLSTLLTKISKGEGGCRENHFFYVQALRDRLLEKTFWFTNNRLVADLAVDHLLLSSTLLIGHAFSPTSQHERISTEIFFTVLPTFQTSS